MNILADIKQTLTPLGIPLETGVFTDTAPDTYIVAVPMSDRFALNADDAPSYDVQEARVSLYSKGNYLRDKNRIIRSLLGADFTITGNRNGIHKLVYKHGSASPEDSGHLQALVSPREKCFFALHLNWITQIWHLN